MSIKYIICVIMLAFLAGCNKSNDTQKSAENSASKEVAEAAKIIEGNIKSAEENYNQQDEDTLPPKKGD
jgi:outer membrane protein assembly factor BamD (BamD/ComL family)